MSIKERVLKAYEELHQMPEIGFEEVQTSAYLAEKLTSFGYQVSTGYGGTGIVGILKGKASGPVVGLRADMDALGHEINGQLVAIHSCGHDAHSSMVLIAAEELAKKEIERGEIQILFQPAEEKFGAPKMIADGAGKDLDILFGVHLRPGQEAPDGCMTPALHHGASYMVKAYIEGKTAHGARPHLGINAIHGASAVIQAVLGIYPDPMIPSSIKATQISGGGPVANAIPASAEITFDVRSRSNDAMKLLLSQLETAIIQGAASIGAKGRIEILGGVPAAEYDPEMVQLAKEAISEIAGPDKLLDESITPGGEDFHYFTQSIPGLKTAYIGLGCGLTPGLHDPEMSFNRNSLEVGTKTLIRMVEKALNK